jgi:transketolase
MTEKDCMDQYYDAKLREQLHPSMRGYFAYELHQEMEKNKDIWVLVGDLGQGMMDKIRDDFPDRFLNCGASEQAMVGLAVGLALEGKIPVVYSITNFVLYRPFEWIRNYLDHEQIPVKLVGAGRDEDYAHDGYTHHSQDAKQVLDCFPNIVQFWPENKEEMGTMVRELLFNGKASFISLRR